MRRLAILMLLMAVTEWRVACAQDPLSGIASGAGVYFGAQELGQHFDKAMEALDVIRARAIQQGNLALAERIDQAAMETQRLLHGINKDVQLDIDKLDESAQTAIHDMDKSIQELANAAIHNITTNLDQQVFDFCRDSILCKPSYDISFTQNTVISEAVSVLNPILVGGTAFISDAQVTAEIGGTKLPGSDVVRKDPNTFGIAVPQAIIPRDRYAVKVYPLVISVAADIDNPDRSGLGKLALWRPSRVHKDPLALLNVGLYVLPEYPVSVRVVEHQSTEGWRKCDASENYCQQPQITKTTQGVARDSLTLMQLKDDEKLDEDNMQWPGMIDPASHDGGVVTDVSWDDRYIFICSKPFEDDSGLQRVVKATCLNVVPKRWCGGNDAMTEAHSNNPAVREHLIYQTFYSGVNSCSEPACPCARQATFSFRLMKRANKIVDRDLKVANVPATGQGGTTDLGFASYCSDQLNDAQSGFSVYVSPNFQPDGHDHPIELRPGASSTTIANSVEVRVGKENNGAVSCVSISVEPSAH